MFKNYIKVAFRSFRKHKTYAAVNIIGLAVGMASCVLIFMLVWHEWSYDRFHENGDSLYRTVLHYKSPDGEPAYQAMMTPEFTESLLAAFPSIERATPFTAQDMDLQIGDDFYRHRLAEVSDDFLMMFSFPMIVGDPETALDDPGSIVVTAEVAGILFDLAPDRTFEAMGRTVSIPVGDAVYDFNVAGVVCDFPQNTSIAFDAAISFENYGNIRVGGNNWGGRVSTYVQLTNGVSGAGLEEAFATWVETEFARYIQSMQGASNMAEGDGAYALRLQSLSAMHLNPTIWVPYEVRPHNPLYSYVLTGIGLLILLIACINFMTLSVGQSAGRAREVGMRKVLGAHRGQLMKQYWGESLVMTAISLSMGMILAVLALPAFKNITGTALSLTTLTPGLIAAAVLGLMIVVGLFAGGYPAVVLSRFRPVAVLKGDLHSPRRSWLTRSLVVLQYTISIGLIVSMRIMSQQLGFMFDKDLGYEQDLVVAVNSRPVSRSEADGFLERFRNTLLPYGQITHISRAGSSFTRGSDRNTWSDGDGNTKSAYNFGVDYDYVDLLGMEMVEGRNFSREYPSDPRRSILVNESLVRDFGIEDPIGYSLTGWEGIFMTDEPAPVIIGVVKDFHFRSLRTSVDPAVMNMHPDYYNYLGAVLLKIRGADVAATLALIEAAWNENLPGRPFAYSFLDADIAAQYQTEQQWSQIVTYSSLLAILIACLGLFGLAVLSVARRTKEIGIRKIMGASVPGVATLIAREFAWLVIFASILAAPLAYFAMSAWLEDFAFHIQIGPGVFVLAALCALGLSMLTVVFHSVKAARSNPVETLRCE